MSSRIKVLCITSAMTALMAESTAAYLAGREPAIFFGPAYVVLIAGWMVCGIVSVLAERDLRHRKEDYRTAVTITRWRLTDDDSGSWRRPWVD